MEGSVGAVKVPETRHSRLWLLALLVLLALSAAACSRSTAVAAVGEVGDECFLGLDLWDTDPALTWIEDGRVWVRAGDHQACLSFTDAAELEWSPDGLRLLLDDHLIVAGAQEATAEVAHSSAVVWQQPFGESLYAFGATGSVATFGLGPGPELPSGAVMIASHPDADHFAVASSTGQITLTNRRGAVLADLLALRTDEEVVQMEFAADGSRLWVLTDHSGVSTVWFVDMLPISSFLEIDPIESIVPVMAPPPPELYFVDTALAAAEPVLPTGIGASGDEFTSFVLHPAHRDWIAVSAGKCADAQSSLFLDGELMSGGLPGTAVGFFRGHGLPVLATTTAGGDCGNGQLWVVTDLPRDGTATLIAEGVASADIRDEAPDPWNPNTAPPFA